MMVKRSNRPETRRLRKFANEAERSRKIEGMKKMKKGKLLVRSRYVLKVGVGRCWPERLESSTASA